LPGDCGKAKARRGFEAMAKRAAKVNKARAQARPAAKRKPARKGTAKRKAARTAPPRTVTVVIPQMITLSLPPVLHDRLKALSRAMDLPMEGVVRQALTEFADTWEDHHRTVAALAETSDRVQLAVKE
jgi:hypothetical protein